MLGIFLEINWADSERPVQKDPSKHSPRKLQ